MNAHEYMKQFVEGMVQGGWFDFDAPPPKRSIRDLKPKVSGPASDIPEPTSTPPDRMTKSDQRLADAVALLLSSGFSQDGATQGKNVRVVTFQSYPLAGKTVRIGDRMRFKRGDDMATVGKKTVFLYRKRPKNSVVDFLDEENLKLPTKEFSTWTKEDVDDAFSGMVEPYASAEIAVHPWKMWVSIKRKSVDREGKDEKRVLISGKSDAKLPGVIDWLKGYGLDDADISVEEVS